MSGMAEVLAAHLAEHLGIALAEPLGWIIPASVLAPVIDGITSDLDAALSAVGFGSVVEAKAEALEEAAAEVDEGVPAYGQEEYADWLRARAAEMRKP